MFAPEGYSGANSYVDAARAAARARGWPDPRVRPTSSDRSARGRRIQIIDPQDAVNLYQRLHRACTAVLSIQPPGAPGPVVCTRPDRRHALVARAVRSLRLFCAYKAFFRKLSDPLRPAGWVAQFIHWCGCVGCAGDHDPRVLPLHVFMPTSLRCLRDLRDAPGRVAFEAQHARGAGGRYDRAGLLWEHAHEQHAVQPNDHLTVANTPLTPGMHWNVQAGGRRARIHTPMAEWEFTKHMNVYPDAKLRGTDGARRLK